jgi:hypothetical protein
MDKEQCKMDKGKWTGGYVRRTPLSTVHCQLSIPNRLLFDHHVSNFASGMGKLLMADHKNYNYENQIKHCFIAGIFCRWH